MIAIEIVRHRLALAVRVDDHFTKEAYADELAIELDSRESAIRSVDAAGRRHADGTYRFVEPVKPGVRTVRVTGPDVFTWTPTTNVTLPLLAPLSPLVIEVWPKSSARVPTGATAIRGRLQSLPPAAPVAIGQRIEIEVVGTAPRLRRTRTDERGEFLFVVLGPAELNATHEVELVANAPGRMIASIDVVDGTAITSFAGSTFPVRPGREVRALFHLS